MSSLISSEEELDDTSVLSSENSISGAYLSKSCTLPINLLEFQFSFGYDCKRFQNLCLIQPDILVFATGNLIVFFTISTKEIKTRRSAGGNGIGFITKNPNPEYNYLTIAENGINPPIFIYKYPEMEIITTCKGGTQRSYSCIDYTIDGELMASQGGDPDYMLTIWNWKESNIILRTRSFQTDVLNVKFSHYHLSHIVTGGLSHIKFWQISETFTGLKLQGTIGRFGKTESADIFGMHLMPDGQVLSNSKHGNILVWDEGRIKFEVCKKNREQCHNAPITQIFFNNGEVMTIGKDGCVRVWFWETVDLADPPDDDRFVEIQPIYEYTIGTPEHRCELMTLVPMKDINGSWWYAQDGNGGIWLCDLAKDNKPKLSERLYRCHAGPIADIGTCSYTHYFATLGTDGVLHIYNYIDNKLVLYKKFNAKGKALIWLPTTIDESGNVIIMAFDDGVIRIVVINIDERSLYSDEAIQKNVYLIQAIKPHTSSITTLSINPLRTVLVSAAEDKTIFVHRIQRSTTFISLQPIGFIEMPSTVTAINWKPDMPSTILIGCVFGQVLEADLPDVPQPTSQTYNLKHIHPKLHVFKSTKSQILRDIKIKEIEKKKLAKRKKKMEKLERLRIDNPGIEINDEQFLADSESDEELEPIFIPKIPNKVLWLQYTSDNTIWLSMSGYDAGYIYEIDFNAIEQPMKCTLICDGQDIEINSYLHFQNFLLFGMQNGAIRVTNKQDDFHDLTDYWLLNMHDNAKGFINKLILSYDHKYLFTIGNDGNIFSYLWKNVEIIDPTGSIVEPLDIFAKPIAVNDIEDLQHLSIEEQKQKENSDRKKQIANKNKAKVLEILGEYKIEFRKLQQDNIKIPEAFRITQTELELDERITNDLNETLKAQFELVQRKLAFDLEKSKLAVKKLNDFFIKKIQNSTIKIYGIQTSNYVKSIRLEKFYENFEATKTDLEEQIRIVIENRSKVEAEESAGESEKEIRTLKLQSFLQDLTETTAEFKLAPQMRRLFKKYRDRKLKEDIRRDTWLAVNAVTPNLNVNHPEDIKAIKEAENAIGDYKLKIDPDYVPNIEEADTFLTKLMEILRINQENYQIQSDYNGKVFELKNNKIEILNWICDRFNKFILIEQEFEQDHIDELQTAIKKLNDSVQAMLSRNDVKSDEFEFFSDEETSKINRNILININEMLKLCHNILTKRNDNNKQQLHEYHDINYSNAENWIVEINKKKYIYNDFEQKQILINIKKSIKDFDNKIESISNESIEVEVASKLFETFLLTLNRELWIHKNFEKLENQLVKLIDEQILLKNQVQSNIQLYRNKIEQSKNDIEQLIEHKKTLELQFETVCLPNNKFADFLKKIFKKRFKKIKIKANEFEESSSSSSSSAGSSEDDVDDLLSIDSLTQMNVPILNENVCPPGCDKRIYELTLSFRSERHIVEQNIKEEHEFIEEYRDKIKKFNESMIAIDSKLIHKTQELNEVKREKQSQLNEIESAVVIKMDQMQYFQTDEEFYDIDKTLLFHKQNISKLYTRVGQLAGETIKTRRKHRINIIHLARMKTDIKYMQKHIIELEEKNREAIIKKFGTLVDLDELEESILRRFVFNMKGNIDKKTAEFDKKRIKLKKILSEKQTNLSRVIQEGIEKLNVLTVLQEEKNILTEQSRKSAKFEVSIDYSNDLSKLKEISRQQQQQIMMLEKEIRTLRSKEKPSGFGPPDSVMDAKASSGYQVYTSQDSNDDGGGIRGVSHTHSTIDPYDTPREDEDIDYPGSRTFYDSACVMQSRRSSDKSVQQPNKDDIIKITNITSRFFVENLGLNQIDITPRSIEFTNAILKFLTENKLNVEQRDNFVKFIVEYLETNIEKDIFLKVSSKNFHAFFDEILNLLIVDEFEIDPIELLASIIEETKDGLKLKVDKENYTNNFLIEIFKEIFAIMSINDIQDSLDKLLLVLSKEKTIKIEDTNIKDISERIYQSMEANMVNDTVSLDVIQQLLNDIKEKMTKL